MRLGPILKEGGSELHALVHSDFGLIVEGGVSIIIGRKSDEILAKR